MSLRVASTLFVPTSEDTRVIQLCFGDITGLSVEDKVDVILISAFPSKTRSINSSVLRFLSEYSQLGLENENTILLNNLVHVVYKIDEKNEPLKFVNDENSITRVM